MRDYDWHAAILDYDYTRQSCRVAIYRHQGSRTELLNGDGTIATEEDGVVPAVDRLFQVPWDALAAIRDAIDERLGRRTDDKVLAETRDALAVERARVDRVLAHLAVGEDA